MVDETYPFSVVELEDGLVLVPTKWIVSPGNNNKFVCYYPPIDDKMTVNMLVSKLVDPKITWKQYIVLNYLKKISKN